jgi:CRISPR-associated protein Csm1
LAVFHHRPDSAVREMGGAAWIIAQADRLAAGLDRASAVRRDEADGVANDDAGGRQWDSFIRTPMRNPFASVRLSDTLGAVPDSQLPLTTMLPTRESFPQPAVDASQFQAKYAAMWKEFQSEFRRITQLENRHLFFEALLELSERFLSAVPSSTKDQPDVSLHDHAHATAAVATALSQWHQEAGTHETEAHIEDLKTPKFRMLVGDLSGIQSTLFQLANERVKGVNRILRARSFVFGMIVEAAAMEAIERLGVTPFSRLQNAGGRFLILLPALAGTAGQVEGLQRVIDGWMMQRWRGQLSLNLALTEPFSGEFLQRGRFRELQGLIGEAAEAAKQQPLFRAYQAVHRGDRYPHGECFACGSRPAQGNDAGCVVCEEKSGLGRDLPKLRMGAWSRSRSTAASGSMPLWNGLYFHWFCDEPKFVPAEWISGWQTNSADGMGGLPRRRLANYVPRAAAGNREASRYRGLGADDFAKPGEIKTFAEIARDSLEESEEGWSGEDYLGVLKADVDRLGAIFGQGVQSPSLGMVAGLSRRMDFFFTGYLPELLRTEPEYESTYTVYAGGDDLLLIGPWRQMTNLVLRIRQDFAAWTGNNPQITLSAALELVHENEPLNRSANAAEARLQRAKSVDNGSRNRVCVIAEEPVAWGEYEGQLAAARQLAELLQKGWVGLAFLYRMLGLDEDRMHVDRSRLDAKDPKREELRMERVAWRARWSYQVQRNIRENQDLTAEQKAEVERLLQSLMGLGPRDGKGAKAPSARTPITIAVYRNRLFQGRS